MKLVITELMTLTIFVLVFNLPMKNAVKPEENSHSRNLRAHDPPVTTPYKKVAFSTSTGQLEPDLCIQVLCLLCMCSPVCFKCGSKHLLRNDRFIYTHIDEESPACRRTHILVG